ncbi:MAG TPA: sugar ABC transporter substrate-binding protein [Streptosporangiaceae bacterium]|nr:sugar ABC transporter substrate-binding protein [Streptosporangiaceae bacterium]
MLIRRSRRSGMIALLGVVSAGSLVLSACGGSGSSTSAGPVTITVAVTANPLMTTIEQLTPGGFEASHPKIKVKFVTYDENTERANVEKDVAAGGGQYDVVMIGPNDIASWAKNRWIDDLTSYASSDPSYAVSDILKPIRDALSSNGKLYAVPFYGESSFMMYNKQMFAAAHVTMPANPTWTQIAALAAKLNNPSKGIAGICLRGLTGWGDNLAALDTVVNTFGGQWFDTNWNAHLTSPAFEQATSFYVNLVRKYGEKGAGNDSFNQCLNIMEQRKAAMWYDATVAASTLDAKPSPVAGDLGFAPAPVEKTTSSGWLWSWALALEGASKNKSAAWQFMDWATSQKYIAYDASKNGWASVPPGTRTSTYQNPQYQAAAKDFAALTLKVIDSVNVTQPGLQPQPVPGIQYVGIPEFEEFGQQVSAEITAAIDGQESVATALTKSQQIAQQAVVTAGLKK